MKSTLWLSVGSTLFLVHRQAYLLLFFLSEIIMATIPSLVQLSSVEVTKELTKKQSRMLEYKVRKYLPRNLKDIVRRQYLLNKQSDCDGNLLSSLIHDRVGQLDLSDMPCQNMDFLLLCPLLTKLNLRNALNNILNEEDSRFKFDFDAIFAHLPHLQVLFLHFNPDLPDDALVALSNHNNRRLRELDLEHCSSLTDRGFVHLKNLKGLKCLNLAFTHLTDFAIGEIFGRATDMNVTELRLDHCDQITDESIETIFQNQKQKLDIFIMHSCPLLTTKSVQAFESSQNVVKQVTWTIY